MATPTVYYACPCSDLSANPFARSASTATAATTAAATTTTAAATASSRRETDTETEAETEADQDRPFDPYSPRANYALYPLEQLLFCIECHELSCPRCHYDEAVYHYCPSCLLETPSTAVRQEGNRCTRSCSQCPLCFAPLALQSCPDVDAAAAAVRGEVNPATKDGPFILTCPYCAWSTLDVGITLDKSININGQLKKLYAQNQPGAGALPDDWPTSPDASEHPPEGRSRLARETSIDSIFGEELTEASTKKPSDTSHQPAASRDPFTALASFYRTQLADSTPASHFGLSSSYGLDSPSQLSRLLSTFGVSAVKKQRGKVPLMREAQSEAEGLRIVSTSPESQDAAEKLDWETRLSPPQLLAQQLHPHNPALTTTATSAMTAADLKPVPTLLRAKRAKRCRVCRNILLRPDDKRQSTRYKIRLLAASYVPRLSCERLVVFNPSASTGPDRARHFVLQFRNPLYEACRVTLATPAASLADGQTRVTILCPQFDVGATTDTWTEALEGGGAGAGSTATTAASSTATISDAKAQDDAAAATGSRVPEAGKVWARGRNWTSVVLEVLSPVSVAAGGRASRQLEIPVFVRMEYDSDEATTPGGAAGSLRGGRPGGGGPSESDESLSTAPRRTATTKQRRELAYWCVVAGLGRVDGGGGSDSLDPQTTAGD